jgi:peptidyl-prolyl cis-trans isomerase C
MMKFCILAFLFAAVAVDAKKASASHILVKDEAKCNELLKEIEGGASFADLAKEHSTCPSGKSGGSLGEFGPGQMVAEFDKVVFSAPINEVQGPVKVRPNPRSCYSPPLAPSLLSSIEPNTVRHAWCSLFLSLWPFPPADAIRISPHHDHGS